MPPKSLNPKTRKVAKTKALDPQIILDSISKMVMTKEANEEHILFWIERMSEGLGFLGGIYMILARQRLLDERGVKVLADLDAIRASEPLAITGVMDMARDVANLAIARGKESSIETLDKFILGNASGLK